MPGGTPAHDPLSQVVPGKADMGDDYDAIVVQMTQLVEHSDPAQQPPWDGSGLPETAAEMQELDMEDLKRKVTLRRRLRSGVKRHGGWDRAQSKRRDQQRERRGGSRPRAKERAYNWERNTQAEATGCHGVRRLFIAGLRARRHGICSPEP